METLSRQTPPAASGAALDEFDDLGAKALAFRAHVARRLARHLDHLALKCETARTRRRRNRALRALAIDACDFTGPVRHHDRDLGRALEIADAGIWR